MSYLISTEGRRAVEAIVNPDEKSETGGEAIEFYNSIQAKSTTTPQLAQILEESLTTSYANSKLN